LSREEQIIAALVTLGRAKAKIDLQSLRFWIQGISNTYLPDNWEVTARQVLRALEGVGMVRTLGYQTILPEDGLLNSNFSDEVKAALENGPSVSDSAEPQTTGGIGGGGGLAPAGDAPNGSGGGDGFREVLGHPFLFSLPEDEFNELIEAIR
jgi:hypothetical protein